MDETLPWEGPGQYLCPLACLQAEKESVLWRAILIVIYTEGHHSPPPILIVCIIEKVVGVPEWAHLLTCTQDTFYIAPPKASLDIIPDKKSCMNAWLYG